MSENKYSVTITTMSGDRVLTKVIYPAQSYIEIVAAQDAIASGLIRAGLQRAVEMGEDVPKVLLEKHGVAGK